MSKKQRHKTAIKMSINEYFIELTVDDADGNPRHPSSDSGARTNGPDINDRPTNPHCQRQQDSCGKQKLEYN